jgi:hypothetical protein
MGKPAQASKGKRGPSAGKVQVNKFAAQAEIDFTFKNYEQIGRKHLAKLTAQKSKRARLTGYDLFLIEKHFPKLEKRFIAEQRKADQAGAARRKAGRANQRDGLAARPSNNEDAVFKRKESEGGDADDHNARYCS